MLDRRAFLTGTAAATTFSIPLMAKATTPTIAATGGGEFPRDMLRRAMKLGGASRGNVLIAPYAWQDPVEAYQYWQKSLRKSGARSPKLLPLNNSAIGLVREADFILYSGGYQKRQVLSLGKVGGLIKELQEAHQRGTVMAGGSAGAAVMSRLMISGGSKGTAYTRNGLGFLRNVVIDQHVIARKREWRLRQVISNNRSQLGVGIDEDTGILIEGNSFKVYGRSKVIISQWTEKGLEETILRSGNEYDFVSRRRI